MSGSKISKRRWLSKFELGWCRTGKMMKIWKYRPIEDYPRCDYLVETITYILQCQANSTNKKWFKLLMELSK